MRRPLLVCLALSLGLGALALPAAAHRGAHPPQGHSHARPAPPKPTQEQIDRRIERVKKRAAERKANRAQRIKDRKKALRKRLYHRLRGGPLTDEVRAELKLHAQRTAELRRIRYLAAVDGDFAVVVAADKALARENARHEAWWRKSQHPAAASPSASAAAEGAP